MRRLRSVALSRYRTLKRTRILFQALVYRDGNLVSGSLEALVQHMVPTEEYYPDRAYLFAFLLSARLFIKPHELLGEVCALCEHQQNLNGEGGKVSSIPAVCTCDLRAGTKPFAADVACIIVLSRGGHPAPSARTPSPRLRAHTEKYNILLLRKAIKGILSVRS